MFKWTGKSGHRSAGRSANTSRVQGVAAGRGRGLAPAFPVRQAFLPNSPQESGFDNDGPRLQGLEKNLGGGDH